MFGEKRLAKSFVSLFYVIRNFAYKNAERDAVMT